MSRYVSTIVVVHDGEYDLHRARQLVRSAVTTSPFIDVVEMSEQTQLDTDRAARERERYRDRLVLKGDRA